MILGVFLRNYKTYKGINYIPLSNSQKFVGIVGDNGIGKSSILEALDCVFNQKKLNVNITSRRSGLGTTKPHIVPIFYIDKSIFQGEQLNFAKRISERVKLFIETDFASANRPHFNSFKEHLGSIQLNQRKLLLPIGINHSHKVDLGTFTSEDFLTHIFSRSITSITETTASEVNKLDELLKSITTRIDYIYIPKDIDPETFMKLERAEVQTLMGEQLNDIITNNFSDNQLQNLNTGLRDFLDSLSSELVNYSYRTPHTSRQQNLKRADINNLIIESFFNIRKLHKETSSGDWLELEQLSSGEKQKAIIDVADRFLNLHAENGKNLIIAIDEPEASLHMSACFDQFNSLYKISEKCKQLLFTTHWYGFFPIIENGFVNVITKNDTQHFFDQIQLERYIEEIRQQTATSRGSLPYDIRLKRINDFVQSIMASLMLDEPYNWLFCEGSSEKIYFEYYFKDLIDSKKLRIMPMGGTPGIQRLYKNIIGPFDEFKREVKGKIFMLIDTDEQLVEFDTNEGLNPFISCKRMVNREKLTDLIKLSSNPKSPKTEIEDVLNSKITYQTLLHFKEIYPDKLTFITENMDCIENTAYYDLNLGPRDYSKLTEFYDFENIKFEFAKKYVELVKEDDIEPKIITDIKNFFDS